MILGDKMTTQTFIAMSSVKKEKMLIIDDDIESIRLISSALRSKFEVGTLPSNEGLIHALESSKPDMVLIDLHMPNVDGYEVISQIRRHPLFDDLPLVAMSSSSATEIRQKLEKLGVVGFLQKPFYLGSLASQIDSILQSLDSTVISHSKKRIWHNVFSLKHKKQKLNHLVQTAIHHDTPTIFLAWDEPENYLEKELLCYLEAPQLSFLQIKPALLPRFPFLNSFASVVDEMIKLSGFAPGTADIVLGDPLRILKLTGQNVSISQLSQFIREIQFNVQKIHIIHVHNQDEKIQSIAHQLARAFIG